MASCLLVTAARLHNCHVLTTMQSFVTTFMRVSPVCLGR